MKYCEHVDATDKLCGPFFILEDEKTNNCGEAYTLLQCANCSITIRAYREHRVANDGIHETKGEFLEHPECDRCAQQRNGERALREQLLNILEEADFQDRQRRNRKPLKSSGKVTGQKGRPKR